MLQDPKPVEVVAIRHPRGCRSYVAFDPESREACVVDPLLDHLRETLDTLHEHRASLRWIVETHSHGDHLSGAAALHARAGGDVVMHRNTESEIVTTRADDGLTLPLGEHELVVQHAPGITNDALILRAPGAIFTGDTLLIGTVGLRDAPGSDAQAWYQSLRRIFDDEPEQTVLHPGHDDMGRDRTTVKAERRGNRWLREDDLDSFLAIYQADDREPRKDAPKILEANRAGLQKVPRDVEPASGFAAPTELLEPEPMGMEESRAGVTPGLSGLLVAAGFLCAAGTILGWMFTPALHALSLVAALLLLGAGLPALEARRRSRPKGKEFYYTGPSRFTGPDS